MMSFVKSRFAVTGLLAIGVATGLTGGLSGCAKAPESISAAYVSDLGYRDYDCHQLAVEQTRLNQAYASAAAQQDKARSNDIVGVILIGIPVSSLSGDNIAAEIARLKGEQAAIRKVLTAKSC